MKIKETLAKSYVNIKDTIIKINKRNIITTHIDLVSECYISIRYCHVSDI